MQLMSKGTGNQKQATTKSQSSETKSAKEAWITLFLIEDESKYHCNISDLKRMHHAIRLTSLTPTFHAR